MKVEDIKCIINDIELRFAVDEWEIEGIKLWPFIRIENYMLLSYKVLEAKPTKTRSFHFILKILKSKFEFIYSRFFDIRNEARLKNTDIIFLSDGMSYVNLKSKWYNKFCDPIASEFSLRGFTSIRLDLSHNFFTPRHSPSIFIQTSIDNIIISLLLLTKIIKPKFSNEKWSDFENFMKDIYVRKNLISLPSKNELRNRIAKIKKLKNYYCKILERTQPKVGFVVNYYGDDQMAFILACKEHNIPTVDIQHGVQGALHLSYGSWRKVPTTGYSQMPSYFWVWSEKEKDNIDQWSLSIGENKAVVVGSLFNEMWKDNSSELVAEFDNQFERLKIDKINKSVVITLSPNTDYLMAETWEVVKMTQYDYNWFIRVHPGMIHEIGNINKELLHLGITHFNIKESSFLPLQTILRNVDVHITCQSSCVIEAKDFGIKSLITSEYGQSLYKDQIDSQNAFFVKSAKDIIKAMEVVISERREVISNSNSLFTKNKAIEDIVEKYLI